MTFIANPRFKEENFFGINLIVDTETNYVNVNYLYIPLVSAYSFRKLQIQRNKAIERFISNKYYKHFQQFESWDNLNELNTDDTEIFNFFHTNKTSLYYYSENNYYDNLDYDIFEGYYVNRKILPCFISHFQPGADENISKNLI